MEQVPKPRQEDDKDSKKRQEIWSWGAGTDGQLATGKLQDEHSPQVILSLSAFGPITSLSCGGAHVIALLPGGRVLTWGRGTSGQLGHGEIVNSLEPKLVKALEGLVITHVSAGWNHSGFVSDNGVIFTCGEGSFGQLGHGDYKSQCSPLEVLHLSSKHVEQVACGMRHSLVLVRGKEEHQLYGFGLGKRGQLGISTDKVKTTNTPQIIMWLKDLAIVSISANGDHSAALSADGSLYTWGRGFGSSSDTYIPRYLDTALSLKEVALGWNHALLLTGKGELFMLGGNRHGALGDPERTSSTSDASGISKEDIMKITPDRTETKVLQVAAGSEHSALVTENESIMTWGWGEHGQLGLGNAQDQTAPQAVRLGHKFDQKRATSRIYCGSGFSFVVRTHDVDSETK